MKFVVQVMTDPDLLKIACEQFLGRHISAIRSTLLNTLEGHLRCILGEWSTLYLLQVSKSYKVSLIIILYIKLFSTKH